MKSFEYRKVLKLITGKFVRHFIYVNPFDTEITVTSDKLQQQNSNKSVGVKLANSLKTVSHDKR